MAQADSKFKAEFPPPASGSASSEAQCRISFFAQSLTTEIPQPIPVNAMPTFTVSGLVPHYGEKVSCGELSSVPNLLTTSLLEFTIPEGDHSRRRPVHPCYAS
jgi:hypothetical protein